MGALVATLPTIISAAPQVVGLIGGLVNLIHRHENKPPTTLTTAASDGSGIVVVTQSNPGADKKAAVLADFEDIALPFLAPALSLALKRPISSAELMPEISELVDLIVRLNKTLGIFQ